MKNWTIGKRIIFISTFLCCVIAVLVTVAVVRVVEISKISASISDDALPGVILAGKMKIAQASNMINLSQYVATDKPERRKQLEEAMAEITRLNSITIQEYEKAVRSDEEKRDYEVYKTTRGAFVATRKEFLSYAETNPEKAKEILEGPLNEKYKTYLDATDKLVEYNARTGNSQGKKLNSVVRQTTILLAISGAVSVLIGIVVSVIGVSSIRRELRKISGILNNNATEVAAASGQVSDSSQKLAEGANSQAAAIEETSASMEQMSSIVQANANNAQSSKELAEETRHTTATNVEYVQQLKGSVSEALASSSDLTGAMEGIKSSSDSISKIIKTIDEIAFQTNILALNAAVEAARAGEAGMGFAVVADEVRNLAKRSADAAKETTTIIEDSIRKGDAGVRINQVVVQKLGDINHKSQQVDQGLQEILNRVGRVNDAMGQIATASREQSQGIGQVNVALTQMDKITQSNAASAEETASASEELSAQAQELKHAVVDLLRLVEGGKASASSVVRTSPAPSPMKSASPTPSRQQPAPAVSASRAPARQEGIPMESDFKDMN